MPDGSTDNMPDGSTEAMLCQYRITSHRGNELCQYRTWRRSELRQYRASVSEYHRWGRRVVP
eukprot:819399-Rhodomonas_salina.1